MVRELQDRTQNIGRMKKSQLRIFTVLLFIVSFFYTSIITHAQSDPVWTWLGGANTANSVGVYGTKGVADASNQPGARDETINWIDSEGNVFIFGGQGMDAFGSGGLLNDLWMWDGTNWTWVSGDNNINNIGIFGTQGVASASNKPGSKFGSISWMGNDGNLYLFGGQGYDANGTYGNMNDLWRWDGSNWTWISGNNTVDDAGVYGNLGVAAASNKPGARWGSTGWTDASGNFYLFGGDGNDINGSIGNLNDLWRWDGSNWTWLSGDNTIWNGGVYGVKGLAAAANKPGARSFSTSWIDTNGDFYLFGGSNHNDLWRWDGTNWTWMSGGTNTNNSGVYGTKGVADGANFPGGRYVLTSWIGTDGNAYISGGDGIDGTGTQGYLNDVWKWDGTNWTWISGNNTVNHAGVYGTLGVSTVANVTGSRSSSTTWTGKDGKLYLFGGFSHDVNGSQGYANDLWVLNVNNLIAYYPFNGNANDESGNGNDGTLGDGVTSTTFPTLIDDRFGNANSAYNFDGNDDYITDNDFTGHPTGEVSITYMAWIRPNVSHVGNIISFGQRLGNQRSSLLLENGSLGYAGEGNDYSLPYQEELNSWSHVAVTKSGTLLTLYANGLEVGQSTLGSVQNISDGSLKIGINPDLVNELFMGGIDDIRIYDRALSASEISDLYIADAINTETDITAFSLPEQAGVAIINAVNHTVDIAVPYNTDVTGLVATFSLSSGATAQINATNQTSATTVNDFTSTVTYRITAEDGTTFEDWTVTVDDGLVGYYPFNANANDEGGNGLHGTASGGVSLAEDRFGNANSAYSFDGSSGTKITIAENTNLFTVTNQATVSLWVKAYDQIETSISSKGLFDATQLQILIVSTENIPFVDIYNDVTEMSAEATTIGVAETLSSWTHLVATYDGNTARFFYNGLEVSEATVSYDISLNVGDIAIGNNLREPNGAFNGILDDIRIYDIALSSSEISALYNSEKPDKLIFTQVSSDVFPINFTEKAGATWADYDEDGDLDLFVGGASSYLFQNNSGVFTSVAENFTVLSSAFFADLDNDGDLDVYGGSIYRNDNGTYIQTTTVNGASVASDINHDGYLDFFVGGDPSKAYLYSGTDGNLDYTDSGTNFSSHPFMGVWGDYNNDGFDDLLTTHLTEDNNLYRNDNGSFTEITSGVFSFIRPSEMANWIDYDNDGDLDIYVSNFIFRNDGNDQFTEIGLPSDVLTSNWGDIDNDGDLDLMAGASEMLYINDGQGNMTRVGEAISGLKDLFDNRGFALGDYDEDGYLDFFINNDVNDANILYRNNGGTNNWLKVNLIGTESNRSGIGAKVRVKATINGNPVWQLRQKTTNVGNNSQNSALQHFGLGDASSVDSIKIEWPNGQVQYITNATVNQTLEVTETPAGLVAYYPFNGNANDESGNGNDATAFSGVSLTTDRFGVANSAYSFDGIDDYISPNISMINDLSEFTLAGWILTNSNAAGVGFFGQNDMFEFGYNKDVTGEIVAWSDVNGYGATTSNDIVGNWHHVAAVASTESISIYIDGELVGIELMSVTDYGSSTDNFNIGGGGIHDQTGNWFDGKLDDIRIYNQALSASEIADLYDIIPSNGAPTDLTSDNESITENQAIGTVVATFSTTDTDVGDTHTYSLVAGTGDTDNASFTISADQLLSAERFDASVRSLYNIRVQTDDGNGGTFEKSFSITIDEEQNITSIGGYGQVEDSGFIRSSFENQISNTLTLEALIKLDEISSTSPDWYNAFFASDYFSLYYDINESGEKYLAANLNEGSGTNEQWVGIDLNEIGFTTEAWHHVAFTYDNSNMLLYFDGVLVNSISHTWTNIDSSTDLYITINQASSIDEVRIWNVARTAEEIQAASSTEIDAVSSGLVGYWQFNEKTDLGGGNFSTPDATTNNQDLNLTTGSSIIGGTSNASPTDISLNTSTFAENQVSGTLVGTFTTIDADSGDTHTYSLIAGTGDTDNASFTISGDQLLSAEEFDETVESLYNIRVETNDGNGGVFSKEFAITITAEGLELVLSTIPSSIDASNGSSISVDVQNNSLFAANGITFLYRGISEGPSADFLSDKAVTNEGTVYSATLTGNEDPLGIEFKFSAELADGGSIETATSYVNIDHSNDGLTIPSGRILFSETDDTAYRMVSIPLNMTSKNSTSVFNELGKYSTDWRLYSFTPSSSSTGGDFQEQSSTGISMQLGAGYFVLGKTNATITTGAGETADVTPDAPTVIQIKQGWNLIGNPYNFTIHWPDVLAANASVSNIDQLGTQLKVWLGFYSNSSNSQNHLLSFQGGFVFSSEAMAIQIPIVKNKSLTGNGGRQEGGRIEGTADLPSWVTHFSLENQNGFKTQLSIGMHENASVSYDRYDQPSLPSLVASTTMKVAHPEFFVPAFSTDFVPSLDYFEWPITLSDVVEGSRHTISWEVIENESTDKTRILYDVINQKSVNMGELSSYSFAASKGHDFVVYYGREEVINSNLLPHTLTFGDVYPNPAIDQVTIPINIPTLNDGVRVAISVYNLQGGLVKTLTNSNYKSGFYQLKWNRKNDKGNSVVSGVYIISMKTNANNKTMKIILE